MDGELCRKVRCGVEASVKSGEIARVGAAEDDMNGFASMRFLVGPHDDAEKASERFDKSPERTRLKASSPSYTSRSR